MIKHASVHRRTPLLEPGQTIAIAPDTDMNPATRKRKLQPNFEDTATVIRMSNNNHSVIVRDENGREKSVAVKRVRKVRVPPQAKSATPLASIENTIE